MSFYKTFMKLLTSAASSPALLSKDVSWIGTVEIGFFSE